MAVSALVRFGPDQRLVGVLSGPPSEKPVLLLPSAGLQPRSGPFRMHVELAERLEAKGLRTFRYDVPGVGEAPRLNGCDARQATVAAIDQLEAAHGCRTFAVGGICSAADTGWEVANVDARVKAVVLLDGMCWTGPWYHYARMLDRLRRIPGYWRRMLRSVSRLIGGNGNLDATAFRTWPSHETAKTQFVQLVDRGVRQLWIFSGGYAERFMHPRQFEWSFGPVVRNPLVTMHHWPDCDHTYFARGSRERLMATVEDWMVGLGTGAER